MKLPGWVWGTIAQSSEHVQLKQEVLGVIPSGCPGFFPLPSGLYANVDGTKDLDALIQLGYYQHRYM